MVAQNERSNFVTIKSHYMRGILLEVQADNLKIPSHVSMVLVLVLVRDGPNCL